MDPISEILQKMERSTHAYYVYETKETHVSRGTFRRYYVELSKREGWFV